MVQIVQPSTAARSLMTGIPLDAAEQAIAERYFDVVGNMDIRHLWTDTRGAYFRVNWWRTVSDGTTAISQIRRSAFVRVFHDGVKLQVDERTAVTAAARHA